MNNNPYVSDIIDIGDKERIIHMAARGYSIKNKRAEVAILHSRLNFNENAGWEIIEFGELGENVTQLINEGVIFYAGTSFGNIYQSFDLGKTWECIQSELLDNCLMLKNTLPGIIYAGSETKLIKSDDNGKTWKDLGKIFDEAT